MHEETGLSHINPIINKSSRHFISHKELQRIYNIRTNHIVVLHIYSSIPNNWSKILKQVYCSPLTDIQNSIHINKSKLEVEKVKFKDYY